jgi:hypothetical protein
MVAFATLITAAAAQLEPADLSKYGYGKYKQGDVPDIGSCACGPTSAINSFVYLQNRYGFNTLGFGNTPITDANWIASVKELAKDMKLTCPNGVYFDDFVSGKKEYIWRHGLSLKISVESLWKPTSLDWLYQQLQKGQDVEILFGWYADKNDPESMRKGGHYVTITGYDPNTKKMDLIDPGDGGEYTTTSLDGMNFMYDSNMYWSRLEGVIAESPAGYPPIPEPSTYGLLAGCVLIVVTAVQRLRGRR